MRKPTLKELKQLKKAGFKIKSVDKFIDDLGMKVFHRYDKFREKYVFEGSLEGQVITGYDKHGNENAYSLDYLYQNGILK